MEKTDTTTSPTEANYIVVLRKYIDELDALLNKNKHVTKVLDLLKDKTGLKKSYILGGVAATLLLLSFVVVHFFWHAIGGFHGLLTLFTYAVAVGYPIICSLAALEQTDSKENAKWLTYWLCLSSIFFLEQVLPPLKYIWNTYVLLKMIVLFSLLPYKNFNGSALLHKTVLQPLFDLVKPHIKLAEQSLQRAIDKKNAISEEPKKEIADATHQHHE